MSLKHETCAGFGADAIDHAMKRAHEEVPPAVVMPHEATLEHEMRLRALEMATAGPGAAEHYEAVVKRAEAYLGFLQGKAAQ